MDDICVTQLQQTREIQRLVDERSKVGPATNPLQSVREQWIDRQEPDRNAVAGKRSDETAGLDSLAAENIETRGNDDDSRERRSPGYMGRGDGLSRNRRHQSSNDIVVHSWRSRSRPCWCRSISRSR